MDAAEVVCVVDWLDERTVTYQINGGWAVDALHGSQTRSHGDLDVFVDATIVDALVEWLEHRGYTVAEDWRPIRVELRDRERGVDVHPMEIDADGDGIQRGFGDEVFAHRKRDRTAGVIGGRPVVVARADRLRDLRAGYALRPVDHHDLELLRALDDDRG